MTPPFVRRTPWSAADPPVGQTKLPYKAAAGSPRRSRRGAIALETALLLPILLALLIGTEELARVTYNYYMIEKIMSDLARYLGTQLGPNFCNPADPIVTAAVNNALTGTADGSGTPIVNGLTPDMVLVTIENYDPTTTAISQCACSATGCDTSQGGQAPGYIVVSLANGFTVQPLFWGFKVAPFPLVPSVRVPYGGT